MASPLSNTIASQYCNCPEADTVFFVSQSTTDSSIKYIYKKLPNFMESAFVFKIFDFALWG